MRRTKYSTTWGNYVSTQYNYSVTEAPPGCYHYTHREVYECEHTEVGWSYYSPIIIDVTKLGKADTLSGTWKKQGARNIPDYFQTRLFDLDGSGKKRWSWVGSRAGLLVYSASGLPKEITGKDLFGNITWGQPWKDGYEPLATLDENNDGQLSGKELELLYIWLDTNTNAKPDEGEVKPVSAYLISISVLPTRDAEGNSWNEQGATLLDNTKVGSWDWWTSAYSPPTEMRDDEGRVYPVPYTYSVEDSEPVVMYKWEVTDSSNLPEVSGMSGYLRFWKSGNKVYVVGLPSSAKGYFKTPIAEVTYDPTTKEVKWTFDGQLETTIRFNNGEGFEGKSVVLFSDRSYQWKTIPFNDKDKDSLTARTLARADVNQLSRSKHLPLSFLEPAEGGFVLSQGTLQSLLQ
jgi:hypothetical protein